MIQVDIKDFDKLKGILERNFVACKVTDRTSFEYVKANATILAPSNSIGIWVDNLEDPHAILVVTGGKFGVLNEDFAFVNTIYVDPDHHSGGLVQSMIDTAKLWGKSRNAQILQVSDWVYRGEKSKGALWASLGFEKQETLFIQQL